jgi:ketosteroid isomerase-like protein
LCDTRNRRAPAENPADPLAFRATHVYRREDGDWKIVHRHGDLAPVDESPPEDGTTS